MLMKQLHVKAKRRQRQPAPISIFLLFFQMQTLVHAINHIETKHLAKSSLSSSSTCKYSHTTIQTNYYINFYSSQISLIIFSLFVGGVILFGNTYGQQLYSETRVAYLG